MNEQRFDAVIAFPDGSNWFPLVIPCHRVIAGDGSLGGYGGGWWGGRQAGLELKRELLAREGVHPRAKL